MLAEYGMLAKSEWTAQEHVAPGNAHIAARLGRLPEEQSAAIPEFFNLEL